MKQITFKYVTPSNCRDLHVNGAYGSFDQAGNIHMALFNERRAIPSVVTNTVDESGRLGPTQSESFDADVIRTIQVSTIMDLKTAIAIRDWLDDKIKKAAEMREAQNMLH
jgi:hypothetical protein